MPRDLTLEEFASVSAEIAEGDAPLDRILARHELGLDLASWRELSDRWSRILAADESAADAYAEAFTRAQDGLKPAPQMTPEEWAELVVEVGAEGRAALVRRALGPGDHLRLARRWARVLGGDRALAARYAEAFYRATAKRAIT
ncbi:MAG: hypothetical protein ABJE95_04090 [Byssovorax sp.]